MKHSTMIIVHSSTMDKPRALLSMVQLMLIAPDPH